MNLHKQLGLSSCCPPGQPAVLHGKNFNVGYCKQTFRPNTFILAMLIGTIEFCHFIPLSVTLTLAGGHKVSTEQNLLASFSCILFN